jgi:small glutamine-rich tetratricopeptide repeat-containing protein alpha
VRRFSSLIPYLSYRNPLVQCIGEAFGVDSSNQEQATRLSVRPATLQTIFDVFIKTRDKISPNAASASPTASTSKPTTPSAADKAQAEKHKQSGNSHMSSKKYDEAIDAYDKAITLDATNPVYFSNRAAAHSSKGDHLSAIGDAEQAISVDPKFIKAYHRLGFVIKLLKSFRMLSKTFFRHAHYSLGDFQSAANAFEDGLKLDKTNTSLRTGLQNAQARIVPDEDSPPYDNTSESRSAPAGPDLGAGAGLGSMADILSGMGGLGGGGGGMPDIANIMNNPQMMAMAQQMAANGGLSSLMQNPAVANMVFLSFHSLGFSCSDPLSLDESDTVRW